MPKSNTSKVAKYVSDFPDEHLKSDGKILCCSVCEKSVEQFQVTTFTN